MSLPSVPHLEWELGLIHPLRFLAAEPRPLAKAPDGVCADLGVEAPA